MNELVVSSVSIVLPALDDRILVERVAEWLRLDVANGDARADSIKTYLSHFNQWALWCRRHGIDPALAARDHVKEYRSFLNEARHLEGPRKGKKRFAQATIKLKLTTIRRFYQTLVNKGHLPENPVDGIKAPRDRSLQKSVKHLTAGEAENLFKAVKRGRSLKSLRDRAILNLMLLEGLRRVEVMRMSDGDLERLDDPAESSILIHGKGKDRTIYPREDTASLIKEYIAARGPIVPDELGMPLFVSVTKGMKSQGRITRIGLNSVIDKYLIKAGAKRERVSCHALRHTCGHLVYKETRDVKVVQEVLGHDDVSTASIYSHVEENKKARYTSRIAINPRKNE